MSKDLNRDAPLATASRIIDYIGALVDKALVNVKGAVDAAPGTFSEALDDAQVVGYELAMIDADLYAARSILSYAAKCGESSSSDGTSAELEHDMAAVFTADTVARIRWRLDKIRYAVDLTGEDLLPVFESPDTLDFCRTYLAPDQLQKTGARILDSDSHGRSLLDEDKAIIASSFGRVSDEVVAPRAEAIHRQDLTIPAEILDAIADMGCFALSIPEAYGGTAPESGHDNLAMVVVTEELSRGSLAASGSPTTRPEIVSRAIMAGGNEEQKRRWPPSRSPTTVPTSRACA
jgi:(2S)-methylsuccinyl-CoA dehydrogenase